jgi:type IV pilus assembly protein PilN
VIRTNLATRPFYNERAVRLWLLAGGVLVVAATLFNVTRALEYSGSNTELGSAAARDEARAVDLRRQAGKLRAGVDMRQIDRASTEARQANELIDRRTFSWTELFNRFETTLPDEVRIVAVRPRIEQGQGTIVDIIVLSRTVEDVNQFMQNLQDTGAFPEMRPIEEHADEQQSLLQSTIEARYVPSAVKASDRAGATNP